MREAVLLRDKWCQATGLDGHRCWGPLDVHHIVKRSQGGGDEPENGILLCRKAHDWTDASPRSKGGRLTIRRLAEFNWVFVERWSGNSVRLYHPNVPR